LADFPLRGQIWWVDFNPTIGSEQSGIRPAVIISNDVANQHSPVVTVVPMTRTVPKRPYPQNVSVPANRPLPDASTIYCGQVRTVSKQRLRDYRGDLEPEHLEAVNAALAKALGLPTPRLG